MANRAFKIVQYGCQDKNCFFSDHSERTLCEIYSSYEMEKYTNLINLKSIWNYLIWNVWNQHEINWSNMSNLFASSQFTFWNWFSILFFLLSGLCKDVSLSLPFFGSQPNTYRAQVGNSVTLFCQVENLGKFKNTLYWEKFDITLISFKVRGQKVIFFIFDRFKFFARFLQIVFLRISIGISIK